MSRFQSILVPLDFSAHSNRAVEVAIALARGGGRLHLLHAFELPLTIPPYSAEAPKPVLSEIRAAAERELGLAAKRVAEAGIPCDTRLVHGWATDVLADAVRDVPADLIVMGTHGKGGLQHFMLGSLAERTVRTAPCPVATVSTRVAEQGDAKPFRLRRIVVALDFSTCADAALEVAIALAREHGAELVLVHAYELPTTVAMLYDLPVPDLFSDQVREQANALLARSLRSVEAAGIGGTVQLETGRAVEAIRSAAERVEADLIVMGTRGASGFERALLGSVAERTIRTAPCPVLTVREESNGGAGQVRRA